MYTKDKVCRITLRLNEDQFAFVKANSDMLGVSPSEFLRMVVNTSMSQAKNLKITIEERTAVGRENDKADSDNIV